ncbi:MAG: aspartyl/asparaginyl beta-hydroxylase domain-containing protein, partial [Bacteroidia bacterium]
MEFTEKNPKYFYQSEDFKALRVLENSYQTILNELTALRKNAENGYWLDTFPHYLYPQSKNKWQVFTFRFFGIKHPLNCSFCPDTAAILNNLPGLVSADFSYLPANTKIKPHKGFTKMVLRVHLGLIIPKDCGIRVGNETKTWQPGKLIVFDDSYEHEAWNDSDEDRF